MESSKDKDMVDNQLIWKETMDSGFQPFKNVVSRTSEKDKKNLKEFKTLNE